ncbi:MAG: cation diffusion facilitator family transporter [Candidatus Thermoplasmatota archaeon]|jgi:cation diffusion facilitator family transporter|nr:cation diffusion facilitator family transporter [Candidatus Thermoplasmatota archaeon]
MVEDRKKSADIFVTIALLLQAGVLILRIFASVIWRNYALLMESFHIGIDLSITVLVLVSLKITQSNLKNRYSYGLYKLEDLLSLFIAMVVAFYAFDILRNTLSYIPTGDLQSAVIQAVSLVPLFFSGRAKIIGGKMINSPSLRSDGMHTYTDVYEGLGVAAGLLLNYFTGSILFYYAAILIAAITLFYTAYQIGRDSITSLLDLPKDKRVLKRIDSILKGFQSVKMVRGVKARWAGPVIFVEIVLIMEPYLTLKESHGIADSIEDSIKTTMPEIKEVVIHVEPSN